MSSPERRFAALSVAEPRALLALAERVAETAEVELVTGPEAATMLVRLTESVRGEPFHLAEVVVSQAQVRVDGARGDGLVLGADLRRALAAAICDGAAEAGVLAAEVAALVAGTEAETEAARRREQARVAPTRVAVEVLG